MIRTLVVDDDPLAQETHALYLERMDEFEVVGRADGVRAALAEVTARLRSAAPVDLLLLDMTLPDGHGTEVARMLRSEGVDVDIIAVTGVRSVETVRTCLALGAVQYLIKPFGYATFRDRMQAYARYRRGAAPLDRGTTQDEVDALFSLRRAAPTTLPKGLTRPTYLAVVEHLREHGRPTSASEVGAACGVSRVTARRYLEHLADLGLCVRTHRLRSRGRPEIDYIWSG